APRSSWWEERRPPCGRRPAPFGNDRVSAELLRRLPIGEIHMLRSILLAFLVIGLVPAAAAAQGKAKGGAEAVLQQWDADRDGTLDLAEAKKAAAAKFDALDRDHDDTLDRKELGGVLSAKDI